MDPTTYRRRQRRRAIIAWSVGSLALIVVGLVVAFGHEKEEPSPSTGAISRFSYEMSSDQYEAIHKGQGEALVFQQLGSTGMQETEGAQLGLPQFFPAPPSGSVCAFWKLSDAPDHLVRLCFSQLQGVLLEKTVEELGGADAPTTLV